MKPSYVERIDSLKKKGEFEKLEALLLSLHEKNPHDSALVRALALFYHVDMKDHRKSLPFFNKMKLFSTNKRSSANTRYNIGCVHMALGEYDEALTAFNRSLEEFGTPRAKWNKCLSLLHLGQWLDGMKLYEARHEITSRQAVVLPELPIPRVTTLDDIVGKEVLILNEQGFGDMIFFSRVLPWIANHAETVYMRTCSELKTFFQALVPDVNFFDDDSINILSTSQLECWSCLGDLFAMFCLEKEPFPIAGKIEHDWNRLITPKEDENAFLLGVCWACNPISENYEKRSLDLCDLDFLKDIKNMRSFSFQKEGDRPPIWMKDLRDQLDSFYDTAACLSRMDLVVTVDSALAHLAGTLRIPTILAHKEFLDWKWKYRDKNDMSVFYPTLKVVAKEVLRDAVEEHTRSIQSAP